jgi:hypothetical protein
VDLSGQLSNHAQPGVLSYEQVVQLKLLLRDVPPPLRRVMALVSRRHILQPVPKPRKQLQKQVRLSRGQVTRLVGEYQAGRSVAELARLYHIHRTTVLDHLKRAGVPRRFTRRKLTDGDVQAAAELYGQGLSLAKVGKKFGVDATTITREFRQLHVTIRPRRGWLS